MGYLGNSPENQAFTPRVDYFSGNASATAFTLSFPVASVAQVQAVIENVPQNPGDAYTVSGNTITFTSAPPSGTNNIYVYYTSPITQVGALPQSPQIYGNLQFNSTAARIRGDMSNATQSNRLAFQTSTTNGATTLSVLPNGTSTVSAIQMVNNSNPDNAGRVLLSITDTVASVNSTTTGSGTALPLTLNTGGSERMRIDTSGNVGIGTSSPVGKLHVESAGTNYIYTRNGASAGIAGVIFQNTGETRSWRIDDSNLDMYDNSAGATRMRIAASGAVLVGTTSESGVSTGSSVNPGFIISDGGNKGICTSQNNIDTNLYMSKASGYASGIYIRFYITGTQVGKIESNGSSTSYVTSSDYRLKENIAPMTGALAKVALLKPVTYTWKADGSASEGFIAHQLAEVCPEAVSGEKDAVDKEGNIDPQGVDTSFLVATLTAAIQEQQAIIEDLKARIETLENK